MTEKRIDITAKDLITNVKTQEKIASVSISNTVGSVIKNKTYTTQVPHQDSYKFVLTGFGEESIPNDSLFKRVFEFKNVNELISKLIQPFKSENLISQDLFDRVVFYNRFPEELALQSDDFSRIVNYIRVFSDIADSTDDFFGLANPDDDQYANFRKVVSELLRQSDFSSNSIQPFKSDLVSNIDQNIFNVKPVKLEKIDPVDQPYLRFTTPKTELSISSDTTKFNSQLNKTENLGTLDFNIKSIGLNKTDIKAAIDFTKFNFSKILIDANLVLEDFSRVVNYIRNNTELLSVSQDYFINVTKSLNELKLTNEAVTFNTAKDINDNNNINDFNSKEVSSIYNHSSFVTDDNSKVFNKLTLELSNISDLVNLTWYFNRSHEDNIILDDNVFLKNIAKSLETSTIQSDLFSRVVNYNRVFSDNTLNTEIFYNEVTKSLIEIKNTTEFNFINVKKNLIEILFTSESTNYIFSKRLINSISVTDDFFGEANLDDDQYAQSLKSVSDLSIINDIISFTAIFQYSPLDTVSSSELIKYSFSKLFSDTLSNVDQVSLSTNLLKTETSITSQSLFIAIQNYFLEDYVSPGYVGTVYTY